MNIVLAFDGPRIYEIDLDKIESLKDEIKIKLKPDESVPRCPICYAEQREQVKKLVDDPPKTFNALEWRANFELLKELEILRAKVEGE